MAITNHERASKALELLKAGLGPFVERELKNAYQAETARELAYRLYTICERKKRAAEALAYNELVQNWPEIVRLAGESASRGAEPAQATLI